MLDILLLVGSVVGVGGAYFAFSCCWGWAFDLFWGGEVGGCFV